KLSLYNYPSNTTQAKVEWVALYVGNKPMDWSSAPEDIDSAINSKVATTTYNSKIAEIKSTTDAITSRVSNTESSTSSLGTRLSTAEASIKTQAGQISSKVESTTYNTDMNGLKSRVSSAETFISQNKNNILLLAKADGVGSLLNQSPTGFKIAGRLLDIKGLVTFGTFDQATQDKINAINTSATNAQNTANTANSTANTAKTNAQTAQNTANTANSTANAVKTKTDNWTTNTTYIDGGKIYTNTITATQLNVNNIFANSAVVSAIKAYELNADKIKVGTIRGIRYESINASNKTIKLVLEGNTVKSYGAMDTTLKKQNYAEMKDGGLYVFEMAESGSPFGDKKAYVEPARFNAVQGSRSTALEPTELRFWVPNMTGTISYDVVSNGTGYGLRLASNGGVLAENKLGVNEPALQFNHSEAVYIDGWGNLRGGKYASQNATYS
ncbi:alanine-zipper protein, partial [Escherichia coli]|uniref:alanine-zipper protein n=1 Tax=Escherichia coli TaxID=562 RepID=UPI003CED495C